MRKIERQLKYTRKEIQSNPSKIYLFGDNDEQIGYGGQAGEARGEPNARGIPTKKYPSMENGAFYSDAEFESNKSKIDAAFEKIPDDVTVVVPESGLGTGLSKLDIHAPMTLEYINNKLNEL